MHGIKYALTYPSTEILEAKESIAECSGCLFVECFMGKLLPHVVKKCKCDVFRDSVDDALLFIKDAHEKFQLFQAHQWLVNVWKAMEEFKNELALEVQNKKACGDTCIIVVAWKMKFNLEWLCESSQKHFAKKALGGMKMF